LEEAELLEKARSLVGSNPAAALKLTAEHAREFPRGRLSAEADLLAAQALLRMGDATSAKSRAEASLKRYPNGIYARQLREIAAR
jgi:TolA-binding protein